MTEKEALEKIKRIAEGYEDYLCTKCKEQIDEDICDGDCNAYKLYKISQIIEEVH